MWFGQMAFAKRSLQLLTHKVTSSPEEFGSQINMETLDENSDDRRSVEFRRDAVNVVEASSQCFSRLPKEIIHIILTYDARIKYHHGKYVNQICSNDVRYDIIKKIQRPEEYTMSNGFYYFFNFTKLTEDFFLFVHIRINPPPNKPCMKYRFWIKGRDQSYIC